MQKETKLVLQALKALSLPNGENCTHFAPIQRMTHLPRTRVRYLCRHLARLGLAEYQKGLFGEHGELAGSGYCITAEGLKQLAEDSLYGR